MTVAGVTIAGRTIAGKGANRDRNLLLLLGGAVLSLIVATSILAPQTAASDPRPSTTNAAPGGGKAAFLVLQSLGRSVAQWDHPLEELGGVDAPHTTVLLLEPQYSALEKDRLAAAVNGFLGRGGRILTTGAEGALLLPGASVKAGRRFGALCYTQPEGPGPLAAAGSVETYDPVRWSAESPGVRVEQRCGPDAVVVRVPVGSGEAIWWSSPAPLTNAELKTGADLRLFLASVGEGRTVLFDEALGDAVRSKWTAVAGLPLWWLLGQAALVFGLLVFSFSRRRGPVRLPVTVPRSSPVEFAVSMGDLYERAGVTEVAVAAARRRLERVLVRQGGVSQRTLHEGADAVVAALELRFGGVWREVGSHLEAAAVLAGETRPKPGRALHLVRALGEDAERVRTAEGVRE